MAIKLSPEVAKQIRGSIQRFFAEQLEQEIGDLKADLLLDYFLREIGPSVYNKAILDAQTYFEGRVGEVEAALFQPEFRYWTASSRSAAKKAAK